MPQNGSNLHDMQRFYTAELSPGEPLVLGAPILLSQAREDSSKPSPIVLESPPATGMSVAAVVGSAGPHDTFSEDSEPSSPDPPSPDFLPWLLMRSETRRENRMRQESGDSDIQSWSEEVSKVQRGPFASCSPPSPRLLPPHNWSPITSDASSSPSPSQSSLSKRVRRVPPPIYTDIANYSATVARVVRGGYEVEVAEIDGTMLSGESGFEADDECEGRGQASPSPMSSPEMLREADEEESHDVDADCAPPAKKTYAAVAAASPPRAIQRPQGNVLQVVHAKRPESSMHGWQPFVEPLDC